MKFMPAIVRDDGLWVRWFAWHPVRLPAGDIHWLEWVERKRTWVANGLPGGDWDTEYRLAL